MADALREAATKARRLANGSNVDAYRESLADLGRAYLKAYPTAAALSVQGEPQPTEAALKQARWEGIQSVQIQTAEIVRAALELLGAAGDTFPPERLAAFQRVFGGAAPAAPAAAPAPAEPVAIEALAHRIAWRYKKSSDPNHSDTYTFNRATLLQFAAALAALSAPAPAPAEPVAALLRSRSVTTWPHCAVDGKTHYGNWGKWIPTTYQHAKAVTDPSRNTDPVCYEMQPLYAAPAAPAGWQWVPKKATPEMLRAAITAWVHSAATRGTSADNPKSAGHRAWSAALAAAPGAQGGAE